MNIRRSSLLDRKAARGKGRSGPCAAGPDSTKAVKIHRGGAAAEIHRKCPRRIIPFRWHHKRKDKGADYENGLKDPSAPKNYDAESKWTTQGFHDPDIAALSRTVPTPPTSDVQLALQRLSSIEAAAWAGDIKSAFSQGLRNQRDEKKLCLLHRQPAASLERTPMS